VPGRRTEAVNDDLKEVRRDLKVLQRKADLAIGLLAVLVAHAFLRPLFE
jgi:hypothetical protein